LASHTLRKWFQQSTSKTASRSRCSASRPPVRELDGFLLRLTRTREPLAAQLLSRRLRVEGGALRRVRRLLEVAQPQQRRAVRRLHIFRRGRRASR